MAGTATTPSTSIAPRIDTANFDRTVDLIQFSLRQHKEPTRAHMTEPHSGMRERELLAIKENADRIVIGMRRGLDVTAA